MEWVQFATLVLAGIGAAGAVATGYVSLARHIREAKQPAKDEASRWSLEMSTDVGGGWRLAMLRRKLGGSVALRLRSIEIKLPRGSTVAFGDRTKAVGAVTRGQLSSFAPNMETAARKIVFERDLRPETGVDLSPIKFFDLDYALTRFLVSTPPPSRSRRAHSSRRVTIVVEAEEVSAARRTIRIRVTSQPID
jgi:hypothetical protein